MRLHRTALKRIHHVVIGDLELTGDALELPGEGLTLITYTAAADSHAQEQLGFLTSWTASQASGDRHQRSGPGHSTKTERQSPA